MERALEWWQPLVCRDKRRIIEDHEAMNSFRCHAVLPLANCQTPAPKSPD